MTSNYFIFIVLLLSTLSLPIHASENKCSFIFIDLNRIKGTSDFERLLEKSALTIVEFNEFFHPDPKLLKSLYDLAKKGNLDQPLDENLKDIDFLNDPNSTKGKIDFEKLYEQSSSSVLVFNELFHPDPVLLKALQDLISNGNLNQPPTETSRTIDSSIINSANDESLSPER